jgi:Hydrazine synthase alpha subunit middle domain
MKNFRPRDRRHGLLKLIALTLPMLAVLGCSSASSGHAPGVAGGETLTPGITNYPLAYIKRPAPLGVPTKTAPDINVLDLITSTTGGDVYVRSQANAAGAEVNITSSITQGMGDVRDLDVSPDGTHMIFSLRLPLNPNQDNTAVTQPNWHIYQYDATTQVVTQLTNDDITAGHDVGARYLPNGQIVFASTRQIATQSILLNEGRPQYQAVTNNGPQEQAIFLLHVMNADGTGMKQISFNTNHDFAPSVLNNGQIVFSRWELVNGTNQISLYRANPDGTGLELYYGANSHATGANIAGTSDNIIQFLGARQRADGVLLAIARPFLGTQLGGDIVQINATGFVEIHQPSSPTGTPGTGQSTGTGQSSATTLGVTTDANMLSLGGRFAAAYPLYDGTNRMLVSWSPCLVVDTSVTPASTDVCTTTAINGTTVQQAPPQYTLWVYDFGAGTLGPVLSADAGIMITEPVILQARKPAPPVIPAFDPTSSAAAQNMANNGVGLLNISSVYDFGGVDIATPNIAGQANPGEADFYSRPYRFIRIQKAVEIPGKKVRKLDDSDFGPLGRAQGMREILGYAPVQPDGSVQVQVPANVPFTIDIIDANAKRVIPVQHTSWLQVLPGETKSCNGCHSTVAMTSHGRSGLTTAVNPGAPTTGSPFPNTNPQLFANAGETMAQTLARMTCETGSLMICSQILNPDVTYSPIWTAGVTLPAGLPSDSPISYLYSALSTPSPILADFANCSPWSAQCRATIEYFPNQPPLHVGQLKPMWTLSPRFATVNGVVGTTNVACTNCHNTLTSPVPPAVAAVQVPAGQLDLTGGASSVVTTVVTSYEQLLFSHPEQSLNMGVLQEIVPTVTLTAPMTAGSAAGATAFFRMFDTTYHDPVVDHTGYLTPAELRLISEWLDIGGQFYNDPFVAPVAN